ncbi:MAG: hypothetical protein KatS3mg057_0126 [Herpetosiphonaceae bacterium]|nr:MAG: hypothetical protein KatS3mg057_0126 [Herpetosiphonaceae bacterium]
MKLTVPDLGKPILNVDVVTDDLLRLMPSGTAPPPASVALLLTALAQHDGHTYLHSLRVGRRAWRLALALEGNEERAWHVYIAGLLHDIGKLNLPRALLHKPGPLTPEEWQMMRCHPEEGARLAAFAPDLTLFLPAIAAHHERPDGRGYPRRLLEPEIPAESLLIAVAEAVETMLSRPPYAPAMAREAIYRTLLAGAGTRWTARLATLAAQDLVRAGSSAMPYEAAGRAAGSSLPLNGPDSSPFL